MKAVYADGVFPVAPGNITGRNNNNRCVPSDEETRAFLFGFWSPRLPPTLG